MPKQTKRPFSFYFKMSILSFFFSIPFFIIFLAVVFLFGYRINTGVLILTELFFAVIINFILFLIVTDENNNLSFKMSLLRKEKGATEEYIENMRILIENTKSPHRKNIYLANLSSAYAERYQFHLSIAPLRNINLKYLNKFESVNFYINFIFYELMNENLSEADALFYISKSLIFNNYTKIQTIQLSRTLGIQQFYHGKYDECIELLIPLKNSTLPGSLTNTISELYIAKSCIKLSKFDSARKYIEDLSEKCTNDFIAVAIRQLEKDLQ